MAYKPILYDPDKPLAHYEQAGKYYKSVNNSFGFGIAMPIISFFFGAACILYDPWLMAVFALFAIPFTLLSIIGCRARRALLCMISIPLALAAAVVSLISQTVFSPLGFAAYLFSAFAEFKAVSSVNIFLMLKELPGFPFFDPSMEDLTFAALDRHNAEEFIEGDMETEKTFQRFKPEELNPSDEMDELVTGVSLKKDGDVSEEAVGNAETTVYAEAIVTDENLPAKASSETESAYEKMMKVMVEKNREISDVDLFG